jgi:hypothetical protein
VLSLQVVFYLQVYRLNLVCLCCLSHVCYIPLPCTKYEALHYEMFSRLPILSFSYVLIFSSASCSQMTSAFKHRFYTY